MKKIITIIFIIVCIFLFDFPNIWAEDKVFQRFGVDGASPRLMKIIAELNDGWSGVNNLQWEQIEPIPPKNGEHFYKWQKIDKFLNSAQATKRRFQVNIRAFLNNWALSCSDATEVINDNTGRKTGAVIRIKPEHLADWGSFIASFVERYDGDGYNDMPNLKYPITCLQIETEPQNTWESAEGYVEVLSAAYKAAHQANPNVEIMAAGFNTGGFFGLSPDEQEIAFGNQHFRRKMEFMKDFFAASESCFDILSLHLNNDYQDIPPTIEWFKHQMQMNGYQKPIWSEDTASGPLLSRPFATDEDKRKLRLLEENDHETVKWFQEEQAKLLVKKAVTAFACGVEKIFISSDMDWPTYYDPIWRHMGLLDVKGNRKPAFFSFKTLISKIDGFTKVETLNMGKGIFGYCFTRSTGKVCVLWSEEENTVDVSEIFPVTNTMVVTDIFGEVYKTSLLQMSVNSWPIYIESFSISS